MAQNANNYNMVEADNCLIPHGLICKIRADIKPWGHGAEGLEKLEDDGSTSLYWELTIQGGAWDRKKINKRTVLSGDDSSKANTGALFTKMLRSAYGLSGEEKYAAFLETNPSYSPGRAEWLADVA